MKKLVWLAVLLAVVLVPTACAGTPSVGLGPTEGAGVMMAKSYRFDPEMITVVAGTTVTWTNEDDFTHDVHLLNGDGWQSEPVRPGQSTSYTFEQPGQYDYECTFHPQMRGQVIVLPRG